jgi:hypothetical protein
VATYLKLPKMSVRPKSGQLRTSTTATIDNYYQIAHQRQKSGQALQRQQITPTIVIFTQLQKGLDT